MVYRVIGIMSGSSLDGLDIGFIEFQESGGNWSYEIKAAKCLPYDNEWKHKLQHGTELPAYNYCLLHAAYGRFIGEQVNLFIEENDLHHQVQLIASHGHTTFHAPHAGMTAQLGDGAAIAATTQINVVSDLRSLDVAFGGQGAPIVPMGEKLLFKDYSYFLNIGGIANLSSKTERGFIAFDICAANRVLNMLAQAKEKEFDEGGAIASSGHIDVALLSRLDALDYYSRPHPKSLPNSFGTGEVFPLINAFDISTADKLRTYTEHIATQLVRSIEKIKNKESEQGKMLITGGGAFNSFLVERLKQNLNPLNIEVEIPDGLLVNYKEALIMGLLGILRWREEYNVLSSVTGARRSSIGGAVWIGQEG